MIRTHIPDWLAGCSVVKSGPQAHPGNYGVVSGMNNRLAVIHTMECAETAHHSENVSAWAASSDIDASWDFAIDHDDALLCTPYPATSWAAPGVNGEAFNLEHVGSATQGQAGWGDAFSSAQLRVSAKLVAWLCVFNPDGRIPVRRISPAQIKAGEWGICGHDDVTNAYPNLGNGHFDPGPAFPWAYYLRLVQHEVDVLDGKTPATNAPGLAGTGAVLSSPLVQTFKEAVMANADTTTLTSPFILHKGDKNATVYAAAMNGAWRAFNSPTQLSAFLENLGYNARKDGIDWSLVAVSSEDDVYLFHDFLDGLYRNEHGI